MTAAQAERKIDKEIFLFFFPAEREIGARWAIAECLLPVHRRHDGLDLTCREAARIQPPDHRSHTGPRDGVDGYVQIIEHLEDANVCGAARAAAGEHKSNARSRRF